MAPSATELGDCGGVGGCHEDESTEIPGRDKICKAFMKPGTDILCIAAGANDRREGSSAHNRITPSHEPSPLLAVAMDSVIQSLTDLMPKYLSLAVQPDL